MTRSIDHDRETAWALLNEFIESPQLIKHCLAVEAAMRWYANHYGEDETWWGNVGLLHDFDYERWPTQEDHPYRGCEILASRGYSEAFRRAILSHANYSGVTRESLAEKTLFAVDELTGLITAVALVRPSRSIFDVDVSAVRKKMKGKRFAAGVNRDDVIRGAEGIGLDLDRHIANVIEALQGAAELLGLEGVPATDGSRKA